MRRVTDSETDRRVQMVTTGQSVCERLIREPLIASPTRAVFPGSFNPLHDGHREMALLASEILGVPVEFELSITNVDKPTLEDVDIRRRLAQFRGDQIVWLTRASTFVEKARLFPQVTFVMGVDTVLRIASPRYYGKDAQAVQQAVSDIKRRGCRFLVFGRQIDGRFVTLTEASLPAPFGALCESVEETDFRRDISSTDLRQRGL